MSVFISLMIVTRFALCELRERAEAGAVLRCVENTEAKCGIAVKSERTRHESRYLSKNTNYRMSVFISLMIVTRFALCELRERAEAGAVLRCVENTEAKCGIAVKSERIRHESRYLLKKH